jgi:lipoyl(octanoyl) transferase
VTTTPVPAAPAAAAAAIGVRARPGWLIRPPGPVPYGEGYALMHDLAARRLRGEVPDALILLEHPPVYTAGRRWDRSHLVWAEEAMRAAGAEFHLVDRGGSVTFHGPGQLVGYPILDLGPNPDVLAYLRTVEGAIIRACRRVGVELSPDPEATGVWAGDRKVCAIGVRVARARVTLHGFALNCTTDLRWFDAIVPCGLAGRGVATLSELAGREVTVRAMAPLVAAEIEDAFGRTFGEAPAAALAAVAPTERSFSR